MALGYLPDMFGHIAQMPQILAQLGFEHAVVWRGVPAAIDRTGFWWEAPDGSRVRAEYLPTGYGNGAKMPEDAERFLERLATWIDGEREIVRHDPVLWMNGSDHLPHQPFLPQVVADATKLSEGGLEIRITSLAAHLAGAPVEDLPVWRGELRSSARVNLLFGVGSNRVDVRQAAARTERALERLVEPLWAAFVPAEHWPERLLHLAWREVVRNAAHDSVCACSDDEVVEAVLYRYAQARQIATGLADQATRLIGAALAGHEPVVVNPSARTRGGVVEVVRPGDEVQPGEQLVQATPAHRLLDQLPAHEAVVRLNAELDARPNVHGVEFVERDDGALHVLLVVDRERRGRFPALSSVQHLQGLADVDPERPVRLHLSDAARRRVLVRVDDVPGYGWAPVRPSAVDPVVVDGLRMGNGLVLAEVDAARGTFSLDGHGGLGRLVDDGDAGDTYSYNPPRHDVVVEGPEHLDVAVVEHGPLRARIRVEARYRWPARVDDETLARVGEEIVPVSTIVELRAGEHFVRVTTTLENRCEDHRLRAVFPLPQRAGCSRAECAFDVVERGLTADSGPTEVGLPTFPSRRFVHAGGLTVAHEGLLEYELVELSAGGAGALALTLLRANRYLSRGPMSLRPLPAGPVIELRGSQVPGHHTLRYSVAIGEIDPYALAEDTFDDLPVAYGAGLGTMPDLHRALRVEGAQVSSLRRRSGRLELRAFNPTDAEVTLAVPGRAGEIVDLRGRPVAGFEDAVALRPHGLITLALHEAG
jgi:hypothetical protein